jgi:1,2-diacylglycerol 3-alpha-glucosyltransferase
MTARIAAGSPVAGARAAVLFNRFGPYHHARLNAAGRLMPVWGLEACGQEDTYAWDKVEGADHFTRVTLTDRESGDRRWRQELGVKLRAALDKIRPQVVVIPGWISADALHALDWCLSTGTPAVIMSESTAWDEPRKTWKEWIKSRLVQLCSAGLAGGTPHAEYLTQLGLPSDRVFLGYDVVDNNHFAADPATERQPEETRKRLGVPRKFFLASARFIEKKNLFRLIEAYGRYREMARQTEIWDLVLLGDGPLRELLQAKLAASGFAEHVQLPGFKQYDELPMWYHAAEVFIHASTTEQWGLVVNEAMAAGLPVLVSNRCGCARDLVRDGFNGFAFDPGDVAQMATLTGPGPEQSAGR